MKKEYSSLDAGTYLSNGKYKIESLLAIGGMGAVYKGSQNIYGGYLKSVAIKELLSHLSVKRPLLELFFSEAKIHSNLNHSNIVKVLDLFEDKKRYFIVFEWIDGMDLRNVIKSLKHNNKYMPIDVFFYIFYEILQALIYSHNFNIVHKGIKGITHRDITPSNILLSKSGEVKLTDFGISNAGKRLDNFQYVPGKKGYMPPEQSEGMIGESKSDIYSLTVCMIESLSLINPIGFKKKYGYDLKLDKIRNDIPRELFPLFKRCMSDEIKNRYTSLELTEQFANILSGNGIEIGSRTLSEFLNNL